MRGRLRGDCGSGRDLVKIWMTEWDFGFACFMVRPNHVTVIGGTSRQQAVNLEPDLEPSGWDRVSPQMVGQKDVGQVPEYTVWLGEVEAANVGPWDTSMFACFRPSEEVRRTRYPRPEYRSWRRAPSSTLTGSGYPQALSEASLTPCLENVVNASPLTFLAPLSITFQQG
ncbi:hypothetical protein M8818_007739 [Zalaria obscura]|uniref:Uncharacterized protein n=1 Tax=Zalaria obscura TaxID=2024903 RepID=A0ACC3S2K6_9PEZI